MNLPTHDPVHIEMLRKLATLTPDEVHILTYAAAPARDLVLQKLGEPPVQEALLRMLNAAGAVGEQLAAQQMAGKPLS